MSYTDKTHPLTPLKCTCPCHGNDAIKHIAPCCCPHRFVVNLDCGACAPRVVAD